jgi:hypothetical protein
MGVAGAVTKKKGKTGPKPKPDGPRDALIAVKCRTDYKDWYSRLAAQQRETPSSLFDKMAVLYAKSVGFEPPPER